MMKFKKPNRIVGAMLMLIGIAFSQNVSAANILKIGSYSVNPATEFTVLLEADNSSPFVAFQADIPIPTGFSYVEGSAVLNASRISGHALSASLITGNIIRLLGYSVSNTAFLGTSGALVSFKLKSGTVPATYPLVIQNPLLGDSQSANILTSSTNGAVTVLSPNIKLSATELNYGRVALATNLTQSILITNDGNRDLVISSMTFNDSQFTKTDATPFTISSGSSRSISVKFTPSAKGTFAKQIQISSNDPDQSTFSVALNAIAFAVNEIHTGNITGASSSTGKIEFSLNNMEAFTGFQFDLNLPQPMSYSSGTALLFRSIDHSVSVSSINAQTLRVLVFSPGNKYFTGTTGKVLSLDFALNGVAGWYSVGISNVIIANTSGENIVSASFGGSLQITSPDIDAPTTLSFGDVSILSSLRKLHRVYNYGQEALTITQLMFNSDYFKSSQTLPVTIQANQYLDLPVEFTKSVKGTATGSLKIVSNDPDENPFTIQLSGNAFAPNYLLINAQSFTQGESKNIAVEVENEEPFVAIQFDLSYPAGFTPDLNAIALTARKQDHGIAAVALTATSLRILVYSLGQKTFTGKTGPILNIPFKTESNAVPGAYSLTFSNTLMSDVKSENILYASRNGSLTILKFFVLHAIVLKTGWNIISANVIPDNIDLKAIFQTLIDAGKLKKVMDETGKTLENFGAFGGWKNYIGNLSSSKGYKVNVTATSTLSLEGIPVQLPLDIALNTGWNIISFPSATAQDAKTLMQALIDAGKLKKVMDEAGKTIENFGAFGGWINNIGNFAPGKGYKVKVIENCSLTIPASVTKSAVDLPELLPSDHFKTVFTGNGTDHMSINLVNLQSSGLLAGDEIGVFDGKNCVGSATLGTEQLLAGYISIPASANDNLSEKTDGFITGNPIELQLYRAGQTSVLKLTIIDGNELFENNGSLFATVNANDVIHSNNLTDIQFTKNNAGFSCYPNPFTQEITIEVQNPQQTKLIVEIYNITGQRIKSLYKGTNNEKLVLKWNGTNDSGQKVAPGVYFCKVNGLSKHVVFEGENGNE